MVNEYQREMTLGRIFAIQSDIARALPLNLKQCLNQKKLRKLRKGQLKILKLTIVIFRVIIIIGKVIIRRTGQKPLSYMKRQISLIRNLL